MSDIERQVFDAERDGTAPSNADLEPQELDEDRDGIYDEWMLPCEQCHYTKGKHADGCPDGDDDDTGYEVAKDRELGL